MAGPDLSPLIAVIDFESVTVAVLAVASLLAVLYVAWRGSTFVLEAVSGRPLGSTRLRSVPLWMREAEEDEARRQRVAAEWVAAHPVEVAESRRRARAEAEAALASGKYAPGSLMEQAYRKSLEKNR